MSNVTLETSNLTLGNVKLAFGNVKLAFGKVEPRFRKLNLILGYSCAFEMILNQVDLATTNRLIGVLVVTCVSKQMLW